jgi:hypothetical protein
MPTPKSLELHEQLEKDLRFLTKELSRSLQFMTKLVKHDTQFFEDYYKKYGDIRYRPPSPQDPKELGDPTNVDMIMKADSMGLAIKRVVDTISVLESKLKGVSGKKEDPTALPAGNYSPKEQKSHEEDVRERAQRLLKEAAKKK